MLTGHTHWHQSLARQTPSDPATGALVEHREHGEHGAPAVHIPCEPAVQCCGWPPGNPPPPPRAPDTAPRAPGTVSILPGTAPRGPGISQKRQALHPECQALPTVCQPRPQERLAPAPQCARLAPGDLVGLQLCATVIWCLCVPVSL